MFSGNLSEIGKASARSSFHLFLGQASSTLIMAATAVMVGRLLGPEKYGVYTVALTVPSLLILFLDLGISSALVRFVAKLCSDDRSGEAASLARVGVLFKVSASAGISLLAYLLSQQIATGFLGRPDATFFVTIAVLYLPGQAVLQTVSSVYIGLDRADISSYLMNVQAVSKAIISVALVIVGWGVVGALLGAGLGAVLASGVGILFMWKVLPRSGHTVDNNSTLFEGLGPMLSYGFPIYLSALLVGLLPQYYGLVLARFVSDLEIGNYSTTVNFSAITSLVTVPVSTALFPAFSKLSVRKSRESVEKMFRLSVKYTSLIVVPTAVALVLFSREVVYALYGASFEFAPGYLSLYALNFLNTVLGSIVLGNFFSGQGETRAVFKVGVVTFFLSIFTAPVLVSLFRVPGLMVSMLISGLVSAFFSLLLCRRMYGVNIDFSSSFKILLSSIIAAFPVIVFNRLIPISDPLAKLAMGGLIYLGVYLLIAPVIGAVGEEDVRNLREMTDGISVIRPLISRVLRLEAGIVNLVKR